VAQCLIHTRLSWSAAPPQGAIVLVPVSVLMRTRFAAVPRKVRRLTGPALRGLLPGPAPAPTSGIT
jgi:hypothetical protein